MKRPLILYSIVIFFCFKVSGQQPNYIFQHLTTRDGLSSNFVQSVFQDSKGFYWIGTTSGLQIFDGYSFSKPLRADRDVLASPFVTETSNGTIWVSSGSSLYKYNRITNRFIPITSKAYKQRKTSRVFEDSSGNIWISNSVELYKYENQTLREWLKIPLPDFSKTIFSAAQNKNGNVIWFQNNNKLYSVKPSNKAITEQTTFPYQSSSIWADGKYVWLGFWEQYICRYNTISRQKDWFKMPIKSKQKNSTTYATPVCFSRDQRGKLWIGSEGGGLWYFNELTSKFFQLSTDNISPESFHYNEIVYAILPDNEENIWIGSDRGLNVFNTSRQQFYTLNNADLSTNNVPASVSQKPFQTSTGDILIGTDNGGWLQYDKNFNLKKQFTVALNSKSTFWDSCKTHVTCFAEDKTGKIWLGHKGGLLGIYDPQNSNIRYVSVPEFKRHKVCSIQSDLAGNLWFTLRDSSNNLIKWDVHTKVFKLYNDSALIRTEPHESSIIIANNGDIWVQTFGNGVYRFDPVKEKIVEIYRDKLPPYNIPTAIQNVSILGKSTIAIASVAEGFFLINQRQKKFNHLGTNEGLPSDFAKAITTDNYGNYWIAMLSDLVRLDKTGNKIVSFDEDDGILNKSFVYGFTRLSDGRLIITTNTGLLYFNPDSIKVQPPPPEVLITGLKIFSKPILLDSVLQAENKKVCLEHNQNFITIDFVSVSFINRKTMQYFYKLDGLEKQWVNAGTQRFATYTNLKPGKYTFRVKCKNRDDISSGITFLHIVITPPWWFERWAYVLYILASASIVFLIYKNRLRQLELKQAAQIKLMVATQEEERKRISRDLHDDVGTKLSALKLFLSSLKEKAFNSGNKDVSTLAHRSEQFITEAMQDVRQLLLNLSPTILEEFGYTTAVESLVNKINETKRIQFNLVIFGIIHRLQKDYELALYRITQELINNVLKHAEAKQVELQIGKRDDKIILMIEDDGKGFDINAHKDGYGLQNLESRTRFMHGLLTIDSAPGKGTSILIEIPYHFSIS